jgi:hypothetical protein
VPTHIVGLNTILDKRVLISVSLLFTSIIAAAVTSSPSAIASTTSVYCVAAVFISVVSFPYASSPSTADSISSYV